MEKLSIKDIIENKEKIKEMLKKYYAKLGKDIMDEHSMYDSILDRMQKGILTFLVWGDYEGFITCDWQVNSFNGRREGVIWSVLNPSELCTKDEVLRIIEEEGKNREVEAIVFFAQNPLAFNRLINKYGYEMTMGYFEKKLVSS